MSHFAFVESHKCLADRQYHQLERKHSSIPATLPASTHFMPNREIIHAVLSGVLWKKNVSLYQCFVAAQGTNIYLFIYFIPVVQGIESKKEVTVKLPLLYKATIFWPAKLTSCTKDCHYCPVMLFS